MDLHGLVRHAQVANIVSKRFGRDFRQVLPNRLVIAPDGNMFACEFAATHMALVARYVIGTAAALSGDLQYAEQLLLDAEQRLNQITQQGTAAPISVLLHKVQRRIRELYQQWLGGLVAEYTFRRDIDALREAEQIAKKLEQYAPSDYSLHQCTAICAFVFRKDLAEARLAINKCRAINDAAWRYSEAFLYAYEGDLENAYRSYRKAFQSPLDDPTVPNQCEDFIQTVIDEDPARYWLHFCLGLINYQGKGDMQAARRDLA